MKKSLKKSLLIGAVFAEAAMTMNVAQADLREYSFDIDTIEINVTGRKVTAMAVNKQIPGPVIEAVEGDTLRATFCNKMDVETSVHWHGILLPNNQDGVPYINTMPIKSGACFTYEFPIRQNGTYWYHSHSGLQEQQGLYGAMVLHPKEGQEIKTDYEQTVLFSDWIDEKPEQVYANLKSDPEYYAKKKGTVSSWRSALRNGWDGLKNWTDGLAMRMGGVMDVADVGHDAFLANGQKIYHADKIKGGDTVRLRMVNGSAETAYILTSGCGPLKLVANDGQDIVPVLVNKQRIVIGETFDVIIKIPENKSCEVKASSLGKHNKNNMLSNASIILGDGELLTAPSIKKTNPYLRNHNHHSEGHAGHKMPKEHKMENMDNMKHDMGEMSKMSHHEHMKHMNHMMKETEPKIIEKANAYEHLRSPYPTTLPENAPWHEVTLNFTGQMSGYNWSFDNIPFSEAKPIIINEGENIRLTLKNDTMMHHPFHLHGHFFRVLNGQGDYSPMKHTVNIAPNETVILEFEAKEIGEWPAHCHIMYHMKAGMMRTILYNGHKHSDELLNIRPTNPFPNDKKWTGSLNMSVQSHISEAKLQYFNTSNALELSGEWNNKANKESGYEIDALYLRRLTPFFKIYAGINTEKEPEYDAKPEITGVFGARYRALYDIDFDGRVKTNGGLELSVGTEQALADNIIFNGDKLSLEISGTLERTANNQFEKYGSVGLEYKPHENISISGGCNTKFGNDCGGGINFNIAW